MALQDWMDAERWRQRALSFGPAAELYDRVRPNYPLEALAWALDPLGPGAWRIGDIGAGTGIMTRLIIAAGHQVVAVEPNVQMRKRLLDTTPQATAVDGSAESIPLPDASLDGAVAAQAYHWFNREQAHAELARAIRPGGVFAAIWNDRDDAEPWVHAYSRIVEGDRGPDGSGADSGRAAVMSYGDAFGPVERAAFSHATRHTPDSLVKLLQSRSYYLSATERRQAELEREVREPALPPDLAGRTSSSCHMSRSCSRGPHRRRIARGRVSRPGRPAPTHRRQVGGQHRGEVH
jgi:SAM-dependent methyltransferase